MKKLLLLAVAATMLAGTAEATLAPSRRLTYRLPDEGYQWGYRAGSNWLKQPHSDCEIGREWHRALTTRDNYAAVGDQGHADYWQGYADALNWYDNNVCSGSDCPCQ